MKSRIKRAWKRSLGVLKDQGAMGSLRHLSRYLRRQTSRAHRKASPWLPTPLRAPGTHRNTEYALLANPLFDIGSSTIAASRRTELEPAVDRIGTATWFLPYIEHVAFGGAYTIFRFMSDFAARGVRNTIVIHNHADADAAAYQAMLARHFPALGGSRVVVWDQRLENIERLDPSDIAVCTLWSTAYLLLRFNRVNRKYYFIQDYEPMFYAAGSTYALAESTYRFGFTGIFNTPGLMAAVTARHPMRAFAFLPAVDGRFYYPEAEPAHRIRTRIFFYCRPGNPRNAFELGILVIRHLLERFGNRIEIITAGSNWDEGDYGLKGRITNLQLLDGLKAVGDLYRTCDIGFVYMLSKHPSYQPFEFMASGMATVSNYNEDNLWFLHHGDNCMLAEPSPTSMAEAIGLLVDDTGLRERIRASGLRTVNLDWDQQTRQIWAKISGAERALAA